MERTEAQIIETISNLSETNDVLFCLFDNEGQIIRHFSDNSAEYWPQEALQALVNEGNYSVHPIFLTILPPCLNIGIIRIDENRYLLIGPVPQRYVSWEELYRHYAALSPYTTLRTLFLRLSERTQMDMRSFCALISVSTELLCRKFYRITDIVNMFSLPITSTSEQKRPTKRPSIRQISLADNLTFEGLLLNAVSSGSPNLIEEAFQFIADKNSFLDPVAPFEHSKLYLASLISQISRAAIQGGVDFNDALNKLIPYNQLIIRETKYENLFRILHIAVHEYCSTVAGLSREPNASELVQQCKSYIAENIGEKISVQTLSVYCNVSSRTISRHFRQVLDMTVPEYIRHEKLKEARFLLRNTQLPLSQISSSLGFSSQSYFTNCFIKSFDCTPLQYRQHKINL